MKLCYADVQSLVARVVRVPSRTLLHTAPVRTVPPDLRTESGTSHFYVCPPALLASRMDFFSSFLFPEPDFEQQVKQCNRQLRRDIREISMAFVPCVLKNRCYVFSRKRPSTLIQARTESDQEHGTADEERLPPVCSSTSKGYCEGQAGQKADL